MIYVQESLNSVSTFNFVWLKLMSQFHGCILPPTELRGLYSLVLNELSLSHLSVDSLFVQISQQLKGMLLLLKYSSVDCTLPKGLWAVCSSKPTQEGKRKMKEKKEKRVKMVPRATELHTVGTYLRTD